MAHAAQACGKLAQAFGGPLQRRLRVAARIGFNKRAQVIDQAGIGRGHRLAPGTWLAHPLRVDHRVAAQLPQTAPDGAARNTRGPRRRPRSSSTGSKAANRWKITDSSIIPKLYNDPAATGIPDRKTKNHADSFFPDDAKGDKHRYGRSKKAGVGTATFPTSRLANSGNSGQLTAVTLLVTR